MGKQHYCKCGKPIPMPRYSTISPKMCPSCAYAAVYRTKTRNTKNPIPNKKKLFNPKPTNKRTPWREKFTGDMINHVQTKFCNPYIRERDNTCFFGKSISDNGKIADAGHYYSRGAKKGMALSPQNIHGQSKSGNSTLFKGGDLINYRIGLVKRFGEDYVKDLDYLAMISEGSKTLDRMNVIMIGETYKYLLKNRIWVFRQSEFDKIKFELYEKGKIKI